MRSSNDIPAWSGDGEDSLDASERPEDTGEWFVEVDVDCDAEAPGFVKSVAGAAEAAGG